MGELEKLKAQKQIIAEKIYDLETEKRISENRGLIGKCFKYRNTYGQGRSWWLYLKVVAINEEGSLHADSFEDDGEGKVEIVKDKYFCQIGGYIEISSSEYSDAADAVLTKIIPMLNV
jgi:hypothetical protein